MARLENWSVAYLEGSYFVPPELRGSVLCGTVYGHYKCFDGTKVITSAICEVRGRIVKTVNTEYELGTPDEKYLVWLKEHGYVYNAESPLTVR